MKTLFDRIPVMGTVSRAHRDEFGESGWNVRIHARSGAEYVVGDANLDRGYFVWGKGA